jgi:hypothetical protein
VNKQAPRVVLINCFTNAKTQQVITMDCRSRRVLEDVDVVLDALRKSLLPRRSIFGIDRFVQHQLQMLDPHHEMFYCFHHGERDESGPLHRKHNGVALPQKEKLLGGENVDVEGHPSCCQQTADLFELSVLVLLLAESLGDERRQTEVYNGDVYVRFVHLRQERQPFVFLVEVLWFLEVVKIR